MAIQNTPCLLYGSVLVHTERSEPQIALESRIETTLEDLVTTTALQHKLEHTSVEEMCSYYKATYQFWRHLPPHLINKIRTSLVSICNQIPFYPHVLNKIFNPVFASALDTLPLFHQIRACRDSLILLEQERHARSQHTLHIKMLNPGWFNNPNVRIRTPDKLILLQYETEITLLHLQQLDISHSLIEHIDGPRPTRSALQHVKDTLVKTQTALQHQLTCISDVLKQIEEELAEETTSHAEEQSDIDNSCTTNCTIL